MNKVAVVTGAGLGIGKATAIALAKHGLKVVIVCRNKERGENVLNEIKFKSQNSEIELLTADLSSQNSIHSLTNSLLTKYLSLDILIHRAGVLQSKHVLTVDNLETTFAVNHMAPFLLTLNLWPLLKASPQARIITITSRAEELGKINFSDLQGEMKFHPFKSYCQSKLANILLTYELARRLKNSKVTANCLHPGLVDSQLGRNLNVFMKGILRLLRSFMSTPSRASEAITWLAMVPSLSETNGKYYILQSQAKSSTQSYDLKLANDLWLISKSLVRTRGCN